MSREGFGLVKLASLSSRTKRQQALMHPVFAGVRPWRAASPAARFVRDVMGFVEPFAQIDEFAAAAAEGAPLVRRCGVGRGAAVRARYGPLGHKRQQAI